MRGAGAVQCEHAKLRCVKTYQAKSPMFIAAPCYCYATATTVDSASILTKLSTHARMHTQSDSAHRHTDTQAHTHTHCATHLDRLPDPKNPRGPLVLLGGVSGEAGWALGET